MCPRIWNYHLLVVFMRDILKSKINVHTGDYNYIQMKHILIKDTVHFRNWTNSQLMAPKLYNRKAGRSQVWIPVIRPSVAGNPKEQNWPCSLGGRDFVTLFPINYSKTTSLCRWKKFFFFSEYVKLWHKKVKKKKKSRSWFILETYRTVHAFTFSAW